MSTEFDGILFIGDPHVSSKRIGRRKDDYTTSVLAKLSACATLCRDNNLMPIILGDLFHRSYDNGLSMLNRLVRVLKEFQVPPLVLEGNHDKGQTSLSDDDALQLLALTGIIDVILVAGAVGTLRIAGQDVMLHAVPYGSDIPDFVAEQPGVPQLMITHHDLAFGRTYPGALPLKPIANIDMVVNGHMHDTKPSAVFAGTHWNNPGNIEPLSVDLADHLPRAWSWRPGQAFDQLSPHDLPHGTDLFDLTGIQVEASDADEAVKHVLATSGFATLLQSESSLDAQKTDDASVLGADLETVLGAASASDAVATLLRAMMSQVAQAAQAT